MYSKTMSMALVALLPHASTALIASGSDDTTARFWDETTMEPSAEISIFSQHDAQVTGMAFSQDGALFATASIDQTAKVFNVTSGEMIQSFWVSDIESVRSVSFSNDNRRLATASRDNLGRVWDIESGELVFDLLGHERPVYCVVYSPDGSEVVTGSQDALLKIFDANTGEERATLEGHTSFIWGAGYSPDGKTLYSAGSDDTLISWDVASATMNWRTDIEQSGAWSLAVASSGRVATGGQNSGIRVWNTDGTLFKEVQASGRPGPPRQIYGLAFSPDSSQLASGGFETGDVTVWNVDTAEEVGTLKGHEGYVRSVAWSPVV